MKEGARNRRHKPKPSHAANTAGYNCPIFVILTASSGTGHQKRGFGILMLDCKRSNTQREDLVAWHSPTSVTSWIFSICAHFLLEQAGHIR